MGRKRKGRSGVWVNPDKVSSKTVKAKNKERFVKHLNGEGRIDQFIHRLVEVSIPRIPTTVTSYRGRYTLRHSWEIRDPSSHLFQQHLANKENYHSRLYHGTRELAVPYIVLQSFKLPKNKEMFGKAVYVTPDFEKTFGYTDYHRPLIFIVEAILGRVKLMEEGRRTLCLSGAGSGGFDTAYGKGGVTGMKSGRCLHYSEYAVYDPTRIRITHLLEYERMKNL